MDVLLGLISGVNLLKDVSVKGAGGSSLYEIGARTKSSAGALRSGKRAVDGARLVRKGRQLGIGYKELGALLTAIGYSRMEVGAVLDLLRG